MKDPKPLVQFVYEMQIEHYLSNMRTRYTPSIDADLFKSISTESHLPYHPLHNEFVNYYHHDENDRKNRPHDTNKIYFPSRFYHFEWMREAVVLENHLSAAAQTPSCSMYIYHDLFNPREAIESDVLLACSEIFKLQPVTYLYMHFVFCRDSSLIVPRMINPQRLCLYECYLQRLCLYECYLPDQFVRSLIRDLFGAGDSLQFLGLYRINLRPFESLLDELLENLVAHYETHKGQRKLELRLDEGTELSEDFCERWRERCRGVESIDYGIYVF